MSTAKTKLTAGVIWVRRLPRAVVFPVALLLVVVAMTTVASIRHHTSAPSALVASATPAPAVQQRAQPAAPQTPVQPQPAVQHAPPPADSQDPAHAASAAGATPIPTAISTAPATATPPEGVEPGFVRVASLQQDQFSRWTQVSAHVEPMRSSSYTVTAERREKRIVWQAWIKLQAPASLAVLDVGGEANGRVTADVDGASLGGGVEHFRNGRARQQVASLPLAAGWHLVRVTASLDPSGTPAPLATRVSFGDGTNPPQPLMPWAVPVRSAAPAPAASAEPQNTNAVPAAASTTAGAVREKSLQVNP